METVFGEIFPKMLQIRSLAWSGYTSEANIGEEKLIKKHDFVSKAKRECVKKEKVLSSNQ